ncbi:hypothetical protein [Brevundimonas sp. TWP2-3-2]|uniref:hypothetical protein n=1 Tax=unclassified Brevundimonas TaxID=2622653 RepID=UPI003CF9BE66
MRNIGLVSAAVIAMSMAAMAGAVAASAPQENIYRLSEEDRMRIFVSQAEGQILAAVALAERDGLSGEAAQQRIRDYLQNTIQTGPALRGVERASAPELETWRGEMYMALALARRSLITSTRIRHDSDGSLGVSAALARERESRAEQDRADSAAAARLGEQLAESRAERDRAASAAAARPAESRAERNMEGRNVPGNAAAGQPATNAGTTGIRRSRATYDSDLDDEYDPDLDDEAGEPD